jgi:hypothetical protein
MNGLFAPWFSASPYVADADMRRALLQCAAQTTTFGGRQ